MTNQVPLAAGWPAWDLETALPGLREVGWTKGDKLIARKRPQTPASAVGWAGPRGAGVGIDRDVCGRGGSGGQLFSGDEEYHPGPDDDGVVAEAFVEAAEQGHLDRGRDVARPARVLDQLDELSV
ncbi:hypothetical protein [Rhodococcus sp. IEGM 1351]|uniref:hypothetical protein n=1 Tax=unclassified Rhodococcus (in: high G+C Gram-positive bacteria) TaxID=192944 RepID=UPI0024B7479D|nr:hypothetical protein [Rhodococcus sp. IEGM 1351]MDI9940627.1 hypothetical protein [Rhodococcus sp. IEGM 1351]